MSNEIQILENLRANHIKLLHDQPDLINKINNQYDLVKERIIGHKKCKAIFFDRVYRCESCGKPVGIYAKFCEHCTCELDWELNYVRCNSTPNLFGEDICARNNKDNHR